MHPYACGAIPSPQDARDYKASAFMPPELTVLPKQRDFSGLTPRIRNQGAEGGCTGFAVADGVMQAQQSSAGRYRVLSPRDLYDAGKSFDPATLNGEGAYLRNVFKAAQQRGACLEEDWVWVPGKRGEPGPKAADNRVDNKIRTYSAVGNGPEQVKKALYMFGPVGVTINVPEGFWQPQSTGLVPPSTKLTDNYHAVVVVAWDDDRQAFKIKNSWGDSWGAKGFCWYPYSYEFVEGWACTPDIAEDRKPPVIEIPFFFRWLGW